MRCYQQLAAQCVVFEHHWCDVTQLALDEKSAVKNAQILGFGWLTILMQPVAREDMAALVGVETDRDDLIYPIGDWFNPAQLLLARYNLPSARGLNTLL
ncbi:hypothetical protein [Sodalis sp.]|uniref:hypothetical protein n=1 Tax=Sodalis sp. (in: enterobacteria) TaxID=1898979 RepID=UPI0038733CC1